MNIPDILRDSTATACFSLMILEVVLCRKSFLNKIENILMLSWDIKPLILYLTKGDFSAYKLK